MGIFGYVWKIFLFYENLAELRKNLYFFNLNFKKI